MIPFKLTLQQNATVRKQFCAYCIKVLHGEALNYLDEMKRIRQHEVNFSELIPNELNQLCIYDDYSEKERFQILGMDVLINNIDISTALNKLPEKKRKIILMLYFLDMTEEETAKYLQLVQSTVHYHKADSLRLLREMLE